MTEEKTTTAAEQPDILGFVGHPKYFHQISHEQLNLIKKALEPFAYVNAIITNLEQIAQSNGGLLPFTKEDCEYRDEKQPDGSTISKPYKVKNDFWDKHKPKEETSKSLILNKEGKPVTTN